MYDWNDIRHFLAVARTGSALAAARSLKANQTTVTRRVAILEQAIGTKLFDKKHTGYVLTEAGLELLTTAERIETEANAFAQQAAALGRRTSGVIRLTTSEGLANMLVAPALSEFRRLHPEVRVDLVVDERRLDLMRGEADVALRTGERPTENGLAGRRLAPLAWAAYCSRDYAERQGRPDTVESLRRHPLIGAEGAIAALPAWKWLQDALPEAEIVVRTSSITNVISAARAGLGVAILPCLLADGDAQLVRCIGPIPGIESELWLLSRDDSRDLPRIRAFLDFLAAHVAAMRPFLSGNADDSRAERAS